MINKKSAIMSENAREECRLQVRQTLQIHKETMNEWYLGLPVFVARSKTSVFAYSKERVWKRILGWVEKLLSRAGKEILIKTVAQANLKFAMGCFGITKEMCVRSAS